MFSSSLRKSLPFIGLACLCASSALANDTLLVGNSFIMSNQPQGITGVLEGLQQAQGGFGSVRLSDVSKGGYTLSMHAEDAAGDGALNSYLVSGDPDANAFKSVVLQEQSQTPAFHISDNPFGPGYMWDESLVAAEYLDGLASARGATTLFLMTWGYREGDASVPADLFEGFPDYTSMQSALRVGYDMYAEQFSSVSRTVFVAPAGLAFQRVHDDVLAQGQDPLAQESPFSELYSSDGRHPALQGSYLAGCVLYASLTGRDPRRLGWAPEGIDALRRDLLQEAAASVTIEDPYVPRLLPWGAVHRYPFLSDFNDWVQEGESELHLGAPDLRPTARLDRISPPIEALVLGDTLGDAGRLGVFEGARLSVGTRLTLGREGEGVMDIRGGEVDAQELLIALEPGSHGRLDLRGGVLSAEEISIGQGDAEVMIGGGRLVASTLKLDLSLEGGALEIPEAGSISGSLTLGASAELVLSLDALSEDEARLNIGAEGVVSGRLVLTLSEEASLYQGSYVLIEGASLDFEGMTIHAGAFGAEVSLSWERVPFGERERMILSIDGAPRRPLPEEVEPERGAPEGEADDLSDGDPGAQAERDDAEAEADVSGVASDNGERPGHVDSSEGCSSSPSQAPWGGLLSLLACWSIYCVRRRRIRTLR